ncbi:MAG: 4Fe-4S binding protein [Magnetococcales bacterium]|nr:4Fe-4S binding protein [Magnetococcales bacterium]
MQIFLLIFFFLNGMAELHAHGPGRAMRVETGYCDVDSAGMKSSVQWKMPEGASGVSFCLRLRNQESFPVGVRLRFLPGFVTDEGSDVCLMSPEREPGSQGHHFILGEQRCHRGSLVLEPGATREIAGYWTQRPDRSRMESHPDNGRVMVGCVLSDASPLKSAERLHVSGMHIKNRRSMHMARIEGDGSGQTNPVGTVLDRDDPDPSCDPLATLMADRPVQVGVGQAGVIATAVPATGSSMIHPGISPVWVWSGGGLLLLVALLGLVVPDPRSRAPRAGVPLVRVVWIASLVRFLTGSGWPLVWMKWVSILLYGLVIVSGFWGSTEGRESWATLFVWNFWWPLVILSVVLAGTAWCAICPWESLANLLVRGGLVQRGEERDPGLFEVPRLLRNTYPALLLFVGLSWVEMGQNVTTRPELTAWMALLMFFLVVVTLVLFKRKAFCRYFCPVGRVLGLYARLSCVAVRPVEQAVCETCSTLECHHGSERYPPCPTRLTVGRFAQNTYCLSCGSCLLSCPGRNVSWQWRPMASEAVDPGRPSRDGTWFMLLLLGMTLFHGISMTPVWEEWLLWLADGIGESGEPKVGFLLGMLAWMVMPVPVYALAVWFSGPGAFVRRFWASSFVVLPLAMASHLSHNLIHLVREPAGVSVLLGDPLGGIVLPVCSVAGVPVDAGSWHELLFAAARIVLVVFGLHLALLIVRHGQRGPERRGLLTRIWNRLPMTLFSLAVSAATLWLLANDMVMRF